MNIDREIAERVMGWYKTKDRIPDGNINHLLPEWTDNVGTLQPSGIPKYSTNINHAMEVEAEMFRQGWLCLIERQETGMYDVHFHPRIIPEFDRSNWNRAKTLPEAICMAALEAVK